MSKLHAALVAVVAVALGVHTPGNAAEPLSLEQAFERTIQSHPELTALRYTQEGLAAELDRAALPPPLAVGASVENALGTGSASGFHGAELTVSLGSLLERGEKREARIAVANRRLEAIDLLRAGKQLDLLAEVARRYLDVAAAQAAQHVLREELVRREAVIAEATRRFAAGGAPESVTLAAQAAQLRTRGELERAERAQRLAARRLAVSWGEAAPDFEAVEGDLSMLPTMPVYEDLTQRLARTPELMRFAHEARLREARLQLAKSARTPDLTWEVGVRRLQADSDWGLVGSISMPLGSASRAVPEIRAAEAELAAIEFERDAQARTLEATLAEAWGKLDEAIATARALDERLVPQLLRAEAAAERAYRAGALSYLEWAQLQTETTAARRERLEASLAAHRALIELQRLTGETFAVAAPAQDSTP
jgi:cobalt-zinc-cadmium efflux system outer membrane protein